MELTEPEIDEEIADLAFGIFTIYFGKAMEETKRPLFLLLSNESELLKACQETFARFCEEYPPLAGAIHSSIGGCDEICCHYQMGEGILPSETHKMHWIIQDAPGIHPDSVNEEEAGKWLIFLPQDQADAVWSQIRDATWEGTLGISAKVSTIKENPQSRDERLVIYVYTRDWKDVDEVMRVRERLKSFGITDRIGYKRNIETFAGEYSSAGKRVTYYNA
ncbi:DUF1917 domain-containing protein [Methanocalculus taiwanensis]|uniref:DUF1917 domain-containing protein n=1 Tax=Methanocalculus taiwanensis TaxID=106207 RepID=A0ABD4TMW6_9EURY|nr:putative phosphothreonine lyase domain-containg protein [Methanocalculus taiwanensis]MCQ1539185.1 DUF1917 domain-containing protein [Methanocalculus taiwanensis]